MRHERTSEIACVAVAASARLDVLLMVGVGFSCALPLYHATACNVLAATRCCTQGIRPALRPRADDSHRLHHAHAALETVVPSHRPCPALVVDCPCNTVGGNDDAFALFRRFID